MNLQVDRLQRYSQPYQDANGNVGYWVQEISLSHELVALPSFEDCVLDLSKVFPSK